MGTEAPATVSLWKYLLPSDLFQNPQLGCLKDARALTLRQTKPTGTEGATRPPNTVLQAFWFFKGKAYSLNSKIK